MADIRGKKRVFISDIHMGTEESVQGVGDLRPWGWLGPGRARKLGDFLDRVEQDASIGELIILGDLFDDWIIPSQLDPEPGAIFRKIATASQNGPIISALSRIAEGSQKLVYVNGNHDMLFGPEDMEAALGTDRFEFIRTSPGIGVYEADGIVAEHGNAYCLFNAPDPNSCEGHCLPLGYFISRAVAHRAATRGEELDVTDVLAEFIDTYKQSSEVARAVYNAVLEYAGPESGAYLMNGVDRYSGTMAAVSVSNTFGDIYGRWNSVKPGNVRAPISLLDDAGVLQPAADRIYYKNTAAKIVLFGHTHRATMLPSPNLEPGRTSDRTCEFIYANTGTWIGGKPTHYVETILDEDSGRHDVRLMRFKKLAFGFEDSLVMQRHVYLD